jgi:hypothetical protein
MFRALLCSSSGARQTAVAASGFRTNVEVDVFSAVVGFLCNKLVVVVVVVIFPVLLAFIGKNYFIKYLCLYRIFRGRLLELHSPKVITVQ